MLYIINIIHRLRNHCLAPPIFIKMVKYMCRNQYNITNHATRPVGTKSLATNGRHPRSRNKKAAVRPVLAEKHVVMIPIPCTRTPCWNFLQQCTKTAQINFEPLRNRSNCRATLFASIPATYRYFMCINMARGAPSSTVARCIQGLYLFPALPKESLAIGVVPIQAPVPSDLADELGTFVAIYL